MKKLLYVNACVNREKSRTLRIGNGLIDKLNQNNDYEVTEIILEKENIPAMVSETLNKRNDLLKQKNFSDKMFDYANQIKEADCIVIAAPYWDFGFPSILKTYIEAVSVAGIVYTYGEKGPVGLCKADKIYYVTTRGGYADDENDLGYGTIVQVAKFYGINEVKCISANGFDIMTNDPEALVKTAIDNLQSKL